MADKTDRTIGTEFEERRRVRARQSIGDAVAESLGVDAEGLAAIVGGAPNQVREALTEALERGALLEAFHDREAAKEKEPGLCLNAVCREWVSSEGEDVAATGEVTFTGRQNFCGKGPSFAVGCLFRMRQSPPNHLDGATCQPIPEWAEAIDMLRAGGLLEPDDWGRSTGTDFAFHAHTERLWWVVIDLLVESGRIDRCWIEDAGMADRGEQARLAKDLLFPAERP